jgi:ankyrin repeat protein
MYTSARKWKCVSLSLLEIYRDWRAQVWVVVFSLLLTHLLLACLRTYFYVVVFRCIYIYIFQMPLLDKLLSSFSSAIQLPDDFACRLPLHWACIAGAQPNVLQKLIGLHPAALKTTDKLYGRTPLHYVAMHASSLTQVNVVLESEMRAISVKDKQSKTPLDLAEESSNPLKLDILALLQKHKRNSVVRNTKQQRRQSKSSKDNEEAAVTKQQQRAGVACDEWETPLNVKVNKPPAPEHPEYQLPEYSYGGVGKLPTTHVPLSPTLRTSGKGVVAAKNGHNDNNATNNINNNKGIAKAPHTGGFFLDRVMLRTGMERADSSRGSVEDPGPRTNTDSELPRPPGIDRSETWSADSPDQDDIMRLSLQDTLMMNAFDFRCNDAMPLDPYSQPVLSVKSKQRNRSTVPPTHPTRKMKVPPPNSTPQPPQQQQQHDPRRGHPMPPVGSKPKRQSDPIAPSPPIPASPQYNQTKRRSEPTSHTYVDTPGGRAQTNAEREYYLRYQEKMDVYAQQPGPSHRQQPEAPQRAAQPGVTHERGPPSRKKEEEIKGRDLVNGMNSTIRGLSETIACQGRDLKEKESQLADLDLRIDQMKVAEVELIDNLDVAKSTARQNQDTVHQKQTRISDLTRRIQQLQAELRAEEADVQLLERSIPMYVENASHVENKLKAHRDEQGSLGVVRQALDDEKACIVRDLGNSTSELKSLETIQNLAMRDEL